MDTANNQSAGVVGTAQLSAKLEGTVKSSESASGHTVITRGKPDKEPWEKEAEDLEVGLGFGNPKRIEENLGQIKKQIEIEDVSLEASSKIQIEKYL